METGCLLLGELCFKLTHIVSVLEQSGFTTCLKTQKQFSGCRYTRAVFGGYTEFTVDKLPIGLKLPTVVPI